MDTHPLTDEAVARGALKDKEQFALLIERYEATLGRYFERLGVRVREDREDLLQNAFLKAYRNLNSFDPELAFSSWMYRIAHNEAMSFFRAKKARPQVVLGEEGQMLLTELKDESADTTALADARLGAEQLSRGLALLDAKYRDVLTLRFFEERSYAEISDIMELPVGTVATLIHRAKRALRRALDERPSL
jgi:RNA polymerase sigma-70 factor (ECF subfamily)